jgi:8-oxo-dGTP pyrophosphatase MutT (NUDIX family)
MDEMVAAVLVRDGKLLLGLRSSARRLCPNCWDMIGGHVEPSETSEETLCRELQEEIGVTPTVFQGIGELFDETDHCCLYRVDDWAGDEPVICNDEQVDLRWFSVREACALPNLAVDQYRDIFRSIFKSAS